MEDAYAAYLRPEEMFVFIDHVKKERQDEEMARNSAFQAHVQNVQLIATAGSSSAATAAAVSASTAATSYLNNIKKEIPPSSVDVNVNVNVSGKKPHPQIEGFTVDRVMDLALGRSAGNASTPGGSKKSQTIFTCNVCGKEMKCNRSLQRHMMIHKGEFPFECDKCQWRCREIYRLRKHQERHSTTLKKRAPIFVCNVCGKDMKCNRSLRRHMMIHRGEFPFECSMCHWQCREVYQLRKHLERHCTHLNIAQPSFTCNVCGKDMKCNRSLRRHMMVHTGEFPFECKMCQWRCREIYQLRKHQERHSIEPHFECMVCRVCPSKSCVHCSRKNLMLKLEQPKDPDDEDGGAH